MLRKERQEELTLYDLYNKQLLFPYAAFTDDLNLYMQNQERSWGGGGGRVVWPLRATKSKG
jgi:hypothetical protein